MDPAAIQGPLRQCMATSKTPETTRSDLLTRQEIQGEVGIWVIKEVTAILLTEGTKINWALGQA